MGNGGRVLRGNDICAVSTSGADVKYGELLEGFKKMAIFVYSGYFFFGYTAILCAAKAAYLPGHITDEAGEYVHFLHLYPSIIPDGTPQKKFS